MSPIAAYLLGVVTLPALVLIAGSLHWGLSRSSRGLGRCDFCTHRWARRSYAPGERRNWQYALDRGMHRFVWARLPKHKRAFGDWWRSRESRGFINRRWDSRYMA